MSLHNGQVMIIRDFLKTLKDKSALEAVMLSGPRQVGKTTLLDQLDLKSRSFLDDLSLRQKAQEDPAFFLDSLELPCLIDEAQYAPNIFPEIKKRIDQQRRENLKAGRQPHGSQYFLTGSNRLLLDENIKESLAGRCHLFSLHGLSVKEILHYQPKTSLKTIILKGGFPELYTREKISVNQYLNEYILSFVEKDIARTAGIAKIDEFNTVLHLLAARNGQFINFSEIAGAAGVETKTVQSWAGLLERNRILELVGCFESNLSKRIIKSKKLFFYDVGLCARLQGHRDEEALWNSPQAGSLFESLVFSEIIKTRDNFLLDFDLYTWRTKDQNEVDFILKSTDQTLFLEVKMGIHSAKPFKLDTEAIKVFKDTKIQKKIVVTAGGQFQKLDLDTTQIPIQDLGNHLLDICFPDFCTSY